MASRFVSTVYRDGQWTKVSEAAGESPGAVTISPNVQIEEIVRELAAEVERLNARLERTISQFAEPG
jgi:hypothetical protein